MVEQMEARLLRVFIGEGDKCDGRPLYEVIVEEAKTQGLAGATVLRGVLSYGAKGGMHRAKILRLAEDLPLVVEIVDAEAKIAAFQPRLGALLEKAACGAMVTLEKVEAFHYVSKKD